MASLRNVLKGPSLSTAAAVLIGLLTLAVFTPALQNAFVNWDDGTNLVDNPNFRGFSWAHLKWMWTNHLMSRYVPLTWMSFGLDYVIWKRNGFGYHLTSILLHAANAAAFFLLTLALFKRTLSPPDSRQEVTLVLGATFAALFFGLHPLRVESVAWVTERRDVLSGLFYILALLAYLRACSPEQNRPMRRRYYMICLALFLAAILSKEIVVTLPVVFLLLDVYPLRRLGGGTGRWFGREVRNVWLEKIPFFAIALADSAMALYIGIQNHLVEPMAALSGMARIAISAYGMAFYLLKTAVPIGLSPFYPITQHKIAPAGLPFQLSIATVLLITLTCLVLYKRLPALLTAWIAFTVTLLPVGGILQNGLQIAADRYTYLACLGLAILAGAGVVLGCRALAYSLSGKALLASVGLMLLAALGWLTREQIGFWRNSDTLWARAIAVEPSFVAHLNLGTAFFNEGDTLGAIDHYRQAITFSPGFGMGHQNLGKALLDVHRWQEAAQELRISTKLTPTVAGYNGLGRALAMQGQLDDAIAAFQNALKLNPGDAMARENIRRALDLKQAQMRAPRNKPGAR